MKKLLLMRLKEMRYSGDNLGQDIEVTLKVGSQAYRKNLKFRHGHKRLFDEIVFQNVLSEPVIDLSIIAEIKESRERHVDYGSIVEKIKVNLNDTRIRKHTLNIKVFGNGAEKNQKATFSCVLETIIIPATCFVSDVWPYGWLNVKLAKGTIVSLPQFLKVELLKVEKEREYFVIQEGRFKGKKASVRVKKDKTSYLLKEANHNGPAKLYLNKNAKQLTIAGLGNYSVALDEANPIPGGKYDLEIPSAPHKLGTNYLRYSRYAKTWFRLGHIGARFLHVGSISAGCITVIDKTKWTKIYNFLIKSRKDSHSVGRLLIR